MLANYAVEYGASPRQHPGPPCGAGERPRAADARRGPRDEHPQIGEPAGQPSISRG